MDWMPARLNPKEPQLSVRYLNVVSFADEVFPLLWKWIARELRVPAEMPFKANATWTFPSLEMGLVALTSPQLAVLGLFCQVPPLKPHYRESARSLL